MPFFFSGDTESVSSDSGIDSSLSSTSGRSVSDFMDFDEFLSVSNAEAAERQDERRNCPASAEKEAPDSTAVPAANTANPFNQLMLSNLGSLMVQLISSAQAFSSSSKCNRSADTDIKQSLPEETPTDTVRRRRPKYVYNPVPIEKKADRKFIPDKEKDTTYWQRRTKNNLAAKRSRDMRRKKEMEVNKKFQELKEENARLKAEIQRLQANAMQLERKVSNMP